jgi:hypothetical protein
VTSINPNPVLSQSSSGAWDSVDVMNPSVFYTQGVMANYYNVRIPVRLNIHCGDR